MNKDYKIDISKNYTDILLLINTKEKLNSFFNYLVAFIVKDSKKNMEQFEDYYFPVAIHNKRAKVIEIDYNSVVNALSLWAKNILEFEDWNLIPKIFQFSLQWNMSKPSNASVFLTSVVFGMYHRCTSVGFSAGFGTTGYKHLFAIPIIFKNTINNKKLQYAALTFYIKKIEEAIEDNEYKDEFLSIVDDDRFEQIAFGAKACKDEWGADIQSHYEVV